MFALLCIIGLVISAWGIITGSIPLGIVFVISLAISLFILFATLLSGTTLNDLGALALTLSLLLVVYCSCYLFFDIDVKSVLMIGGK